MISSVEFTLNKKENATSLILKNQKCDIDFKIKNIINAISLGIYSKYEKTELDNLETQKAMIEEKISVEKNNLS